MKPVTRRTFLRRMSLLAGLLVVPPGLIFKEAKRRGSTYSVEEMMLSYEEMLRAIYLPAIKEQLLEPTLLGDLPSAKKRKNWRGKVIIQTLNY